MVRRDDDRGVGHVGSEARVLKLIPHSMPQLLGIVAHDGDSIVSIVAHGGDCIHDC